MSRADLAGIALRVAQRRAQRLALREAAQAASKTQQGEPIARSPDGVPCWFIPASAVAERLEQLHPRGAA